jgi:hypothetical protein
MKTINCSRKISAFIMDTGALVSFYAPLMFGYEVAIGLSVPQALASRGLGILANTVIGRPYGIFRDWAWRKTGTTAKSHWTKKAALDVTTAAAMHGPAYAIMLAIVGASIPQILAGIPFVILVSATTGRPYGAYLDWARRVFGR